MSVAFGMQEAQGRWYHFGALSLNPNEANKGIWYPQHPKLGPYDSHTTIVRYFFGGCGYQNTFIISPEPIPKVRDELLGKPPLENGV